MVSVASASRYLTSASLYHPRYQSRSSMHIRGLIPRNFAELAEAVPIEGKLEVTDEQQKQLKQPLQQQKQQNYRCAVKLPEIQFEF